MIPRVAAISPDSWDNPEAVQQFWNIPLFPARSGNRVADDEVSLATAPQTLRHLEHNFDLVEQPQGSPEWLVELARFAIPLGNIGFVRGIDQVLYDGATLHDTVVPPMDGLRWILKVVPYYGAWPPRWNVVGSPPEILPGSISELPELHYNWYPARTTYVPIRLTVQGGTMLRLFFYSPAVPGAQYTWRVLGRLRGQYQYDKSNSGAVENARRCC
jgi:hypothetical protein